MPILYSNPLRFDTPSILMTFFAALEPSVRMNLRQIEIRQYVKKDAKTALAFLAEAKNLKRLRFEVGVANNDSVEKAAGAFWLDAGRLLEAVGLKIEKQMVDQRKARIDVHTEGDDDDEDEDDEVGDSDDDEDEAAGSDDEDEAGSPGSKDGDDAQTKVPSDVDADGDAYASEAMNGDEIIKTTVAKADSDDVFDPDIVNMELLEDAKLAEDSEPAGNSATKGGSKWSNKEDVAKAHKAAEKKIKEGEPKIKVQGHKTFAVDILEFGKTAFKKKDGSNWNVGMKQKFLDELESKLK